MRIDQSTIDDIKTNVDIVSYVGFRIKLKKNGKDYIGLCPFHPDKKPSLIISPTKQLWNCLGACSGNGRSGGDIISFVMKYESCSFQEAIAKLAPAGPIAVHPEIRRKAPALLSLVIDAYHRSYLESRTAQEYISSRGLDPLLAKQYRAGYVDGSLLERVARDSTDWKLLTEIGIITTAGNELMRTCVVFPVTAFNQTPVNLYGRAIKKDLHLYLPGPRKGLFNWNIAKNFEELILAESIIDALSFIQCGYQNVIPIYGVNGFIQEHIDFVLRNRSKKVILAMDSDETGEKASAAIAEKFAKMHVPTSRLLLPEKDANELLAKEGVDGFKKIVDELLKEKTTFVAPIVEDKPKVGQPGPVAEFAEGELTLTIEGRRYNVKGIPKKMYSRMRVAISVSCGDSLYLDSVDLLSARNRSGFAARAAAHFDLPRPILEADLYAILSAVDSYQKQNDQPKEQPKEMTEEERAEALRFLKSPGLLDEVVSDMEKLGYVGEQANKKLGYLASISRFLDDPLSVVILSQSGSGKSYLAEVLQKLTASESVEMYSRLTPASLYYMGENALSHKFVIIEERAGSAEADYSIRSLQSRKELTLLAAVKNPETGKISTAKFKIYGPTAFIETTTASRINYENSTRCFEVYLDESMEQTEAIHRMQRFAKTLEGAKLLAQQKTICEKHHNAQRLLKKVTVVIPYASAIEFPASWLRTRRDHQRFLNLIEVIAFLHQYQKQTRTDSQTGLQYIEANLNDYEIARKLGEEILPETLSDLKKPVADFKERIESYLEKEANGKKLSKSEITFSRRTIREETGLPNHRIKDLFHELEELEYLEVEKSPRGGSFLYRLVSGRNGTRVSSLLSIDQLKKKMYSGGSKKW